MIKYLLILSLLVSDCLAQSWFMANRRTAFSTSTWSPLSLPGLTLWLDANTGMGGYTNGQPVGTWLDSSGSGRNFTQTTETNKPFYTNACLNGKSGIVFTNNNSSLSGASVDLRTLWSQYEGSLCFVIATNEIITSGGAFYVFSHYNSFGDGNNVRTYLDYYNPGACAISGGTLLLSQISPARRTRPRAVVVCMTNNSQVAYTNSVQCSTDNGAMSLNSVSAAPTISSSGSFNFTILCELFVCNRTLTSSEVDSVHAYFKAKYNIW